MSIHFKPKHTISLAMAGLLTAFFLKPCWSADDILIADFEGENYGAWKIEGTAFGTGPARGAIGGQMAVAGFVGKGLVNSYLGGDGTTGKLSSPAFTIERNFINFKIGGGKSENGLGMRLVVDGKTVRSETGPNDRPGGSENLAWTNWDVREFKGKSGTLEIFDNETGGWGHISVDNITQSDTAKAAAPRTREIVATQPWLLLPVKNGAPKSQVTLSVGGQVLRGFAIELADGEPDWWARADISPWKGQKVLITANPLSDESKGLTQMYQDKVLPDEATAYKEALRGQLRFSPLHGWTNDPNGMVYSQGEYHLYFQANPFGWGWDNMQWGHAVSPDMVHWTELPVAIHPNKVGDMVFSGSAVVDKNNTSGWKKGPNDLIVAAYTNYKGIGLGEHIVYSNDKGRTFTEFEGNPVVKHKADGRDPRLLWHEPTKQWVMAVWSEDNSQPVPTDRSGIDLYTSPDLKTWTFQSRVGGYFECADLFELPLENGQKKWVLTAASSEYRIGTFDGKKFVPETPKLPGMQGRDYYAAQTFSQEPKGRTVQIGWFRTETPGMPFNQAMSLPNVLNLKTTPEGPRLTWTPAPELQSLRTETHALGAQSVSETDQNPLAGLNGDLFEIHAEFDPATANEIKFNVRGVDVVYNAQKSEISVGGLHAHAPLIGGKQRLTIFVDRTAVEVYASDGLTFVPFNTNLKADDRDLSLSVNGGTAKFDALTVYDLKSAWK